VLPIPKPEKLPISDGDTASHRLLNNLAPLAELRSA
jgi:hypothetical protein